LESQPPILAIETLKSRLNLKIFIEKPLSNKIAGVTMLETATDYLFWGSRSLPTLDSSNINAAMILRNKEQHILNFAIPPYTE
jgi:hypothetical protein